jgi:ATP-binding cassette, subfamily B, bacterial
MKTRRPPLAQIVRAELSHLGRWRRALQLTKLAVFSGFIATPKWMAGTVVLTLSAAVASVTYPLGYRTMVDGVIHHDVGSIVAGVVMTAGIFAMFWALTIIGATQSTGLTDRVNIWLSTRVGHLLASVPNLEHFERPEYMAEVDLLTQNRRALAASPRLALNLFFTFAQTLVVAILLATVYPVLMVLPLIGISPLLGDDAAVRIQERTTLRLAERTRLANELFAMLTTASTATELRVYGTQDELRTRYESLAKELQRATTRAALLGFACSVGGWVFYALMFGGAIAVLAVRAASGHASIGDVVMAIALIRRVQGQVGSVSDAFGQMITNFRTGLRLLWLESLVERAGKHDIGAVSTRPPERLVNGIEFDNVNFTYPGTDHVVLRDVSLSIPAGATVAIVGENGAGKTTLVKLLMKLYEPTSGRILVDGADLGGMDLDAWRGRCTAAFQDYVRFELRAGHIVGVGDLDRLDNDDDVLAALEVAQGLDVIDSLDEGLDTPLGRTFPAGRDLSGGQWQKLALGRAAMPRRPLLAVLDEPTASLDSQAEAVLFSRLAHTARQVTSGDAITIFVSHRFPSARIADLIVVLDGGTVAEVGDHAGLLSQGGIYAEMFELQAHAYR